MNGYRFRDSITLISASVTVDFKLQSHFPGCVPGWATDCDPGPSGGGPGYFVVFWPRFSHTSPDESRTSHGLRPSDQANRPRTMPDHAGWAPDEPRRPRISHGFAMVHPRTSHGWPRMSHGRAPNIPDEPRTSHGQARMSHGRASSPDRPGSPRMF